MRDMCARFVVPEMFCAIQSYEREDQRRLAPRNLVTQAGESRGRELERLRTGRSSKSELIDNSDME
jgi:hypothetical protein